MNPGKYGVNMGGTKNMFDIRELCFTIKDHAQCNLLFKSPQMPKLNFSD